MVSALTPVLGELMSYNQPGNANGPTGMTGPVLAPAADANKARLQGFAAAHNRASVRTPFSVSGPV